MSMPPDRDLYADLGVDPQAGPAQLRRAYREAALQLHPDRTPDPAAHARFREVTAAYAVLSDPARRADYDQARHRDHNTAPRPPESPAGTGQPAQPAGPADYVPEGDPVVHADYNPTSTGFAPPPPPPAPAPDPAPPPAPCTPPPRAAPPQRPADPFPGGWPAQRIDHRRPLGRVLLAVWNLAPLPRHRLAAALTVLAVAAAAALAAAMATEMPVESSVVGGIAAVALACWALRALTLAVLYLTDHRSTEAR